MRSTDNETSCWVDEELGLVIDELLGKDGIEDVLLDVLVNLLLGDILVVLGGEDDGLQPLGLAVLVVLYGNLGLAVRTEVLQCTVLADLCKLSCQLVSQRNRVRHVLRRLVRRIAEHHTLVAGAGIQIVPHLAFLGLEGLVHAHGNVGRLLVKGYHDRAGIAVKAGLRIVVADFVHGLPHDGGNVELCLRRDLTGHKDEACAGCGLAGYAAHGILLHAGVEDGVRNGIADLVGMAFRHGLGGKKKLLHVLKNLLSRVCCRKNGIRKKRIPSLY